MTTTVVSETLQDLFPGTRRFATLEDLIEEHAEELKKNGGDLQAIPAIAELLAFAEDEFLPQLERFAQKVLLLEMDAEGAKSERIRIQEREQRWARAAVSLKTYILAQMRGRGIKKHKVPAITIAVARNGGNPSVRAKDEATLEELFVLGSPFVEREVIYKIRSEAAIEAAKQDDALRQMTAERLEAEGALEGAQAAALRDWKRDHGEESEPTLEQLEQATLAAFALAVDAAFDHKLPAGILVERGYHVRIS